MAQDNLPTPEVEKPRSWPRYAQEQLSFTTDDLGRKHYRTPEGRRVCGRFKSRKNRAIPNEACLGPPMPAGPCRVHGGASPGAPLTAGGRYSKVLTKWKGHSGPVGRAGAVSEVLRRLRSGREGLGRMEQLGAPRVNPGRPATQQSPKHLCSHREKEIRLGFPAPFGGAHGGVKPNLWKPVRSFASSRSRIVLNPRLDRDSVSAGTLKSSRRSVEENGYEFRDK